MATNTENYGMVMPEGTDLPDITELNGNWETIDNEMARLSDAVKNNAAVDEVNTKIGTTTDAGGNNSQGSVFAKLNKLINELNAHITRWGNDKATKIENINTAVTPNHTANAEGTLSQKLSKLIQDVAKIPTTQVSSQKVHRSYCTTYILFKNTTNTILNVEGAGQLHCVFGEYLNSNYCSSITVDMDGELFEITVPETGKYMFRSVINEDAPNPVAIRPTLTSAYDMPIPLNFKHYITIQVKTLNIEMSPSYVTVNYDLLV